MKLALVKRLLALSLCVALVTGDSMTISAETVSDGNAEITVDSTEEETTGESSEEDSIEEETTEETTEESTEEETTGESSEEETTEEETEAAGIEAEDTVSGGDLGEIIEIEDEEVPLDDSMIVTLEPVTVDGVTITVSGPASAFAEGTTVSAKPVEVSEEVLAAVEASEQAVLRRYKAFEVTLICGGKVVEPLNGAEIEVDFAGDLLLPKADGKVSLYHVDEEAGITRVDTDAAASETQKEE